MEDTFCVIVPTYNRADLLPRTLDSLMAQTYEQWLCWIIDDGSTDQSTDVIQGYVDRDPRFNSIRLPENKGGVAANELGMDIACAKTSWWTRLGSDDTFSPSKLEFDARALRIHEAVYGPFVPESLDGVPEAVRNLPLTASQVKKQLETPGGFAVSWANIAIRTDVLRAVKKKFGSFVDPRLRNMEDLLFNFRLSCVADCIWRGSIDGDLVINPSQEVCAQYRSGEGVAHDATWTRNPIGATASTGQTRYDGELSYGIIAAERQAILWQDESPKHGDTGSAPVFHCTNVTADEAPDITPGPLTELEAKRLIGELLWSRATCNWNVAEHGDRLGKIWEIGQSTARLEGSVVELGVARGGTTRLLSAMFPEKTVYAIDGFEGLVDSDPDYDVLPTRTFMEIDVEVTRKALQSCDNVVLYHGIFPAVIDTRLSNERFCLVHLDTDTYQSIRAGLKFFVPRLVSGGMIFIDDYGWDKAPGVQQAVDELLPDWPELVLYRTTPVQAVLQFKR